MARKTAIITISAEGRDNGKVFLLTEMPASRAEAWGMRALLALAGGGVEVPDNFMGQGLAGIAIMGVQALGKLDWEVARPLLDEMFECIKVVPNASKPDVVRNLAEDDIEDVKTRFRLRKEILDLHIDFFTDAGLLTQARQAIAATASS